MHALIGQRQKHCRHFEDTRILSLVMEKVEFNVGSSRKRKRGERIFQFQTFCEPGQPVLFSGCFQENMKELLAFGSPEDVVSEGMQCWSFQLELNHYPSTCVKLFVAEEVVGLSLYRHCNHCRSVGWGHHMICNKRFHFLLPCKGSRPRMENLSIGVSSSKGLRKEASNSKTTDSDGHLLHGVIHSNGFGHLIAINGIEGDSEFLLGHEILDLWDRICTSLQLRKVSITDTAKKSGMESRLIHGLAYGHPWFGRWGYKFLKGTFGVTEQLYQNSLDLIRSRPLFLLLSFFACNIRSEIPMLIRKYQAFSGHTLITLSDLFRFMFELNHHLPQNAPTAFDFHGIVTEPTCRWSIKRVEMATQVIVGALKKTEFRWVTRQEVRDAARAYIGDTGLLDYVLKSLGNHIVGNYIVRRMVNPITKVLEYCLQDVSSVFPGSVRFQVTKVQLMRDMSYLYKHILIRDHSAAGVNGGVLGAIPMAVRAILDAKHLVKDYTEEGFNLLQGNDHLKIMCTVQVTNRDKEPKALQPYEMVVLPSNATVGDLKREAEKRFRDLYLGLKNLTAESVAGVVNVQDSEFIVEIGEHCNGVVIQGRVVNGETDKQDDELYEGGSNVERVVECICGAKEDDNEQMVCCDICENWQHTRCVGVAADGEVPRVFLCSRCENNISALSPIKY